MIKRISRTLDKLESHSSTTDVVMRPSLHNRILTNNMSTHSRSGTQKKTEKPRLVLKNCRKTKHIRTLVDFFVALCANVSMVASIKALKIRFIMLRMARDQLKTIS